MKKSQTWLLGSSRSRTVNHVYVCMVINMLVIIRQQLGYDRDFGWQARVAHETLVLCGTRARRRTIFDMAEYPENLNSLQFIRRITCIMYIILLYK